MKPITPISRDHENLYRSCVSQTQSNTPRQILLDMTTRVVSCGNQYVTALQAGQPSAVTQMTMTDVERTEIKKLYNYRLASQNGIERRTYDEIVSLATECPFCGFGEVYEVDHYLPQEDFPELNVLPKNLVPICHPCNHIKLSYRPTAPTNSLLHPYFDQLPNERWLFAELSIDNGGPVLTFSVKLTNINHPLRPRLDFHFQKFDLPRRMRERAARVLVEMEADINDYLSELGKEGLQSHFLDAGERNFVRHGNVIETAAYFAAAENEEYCSGGHHS